jgi:signal transduction histidine kinase
MNESGTLEVSVSSHGDTWQIAFTDSGPGVPADIRDRVFGTVVTMILPQSAGLCAK